MKAGKVIKSWDDMPWRARWRVRVGYPFLVWRLKHFAKRMDCGCTKALGRRVTSRMDCPKHGIEEWQRRAGMTVRKPHDG